MKELAEYSERNFQIGFWTLSFRESIENQEEDESKKM